MYPGVILFDYDVPTGTYGRNIDSERQLKGLTSSLQKRAAIPLLVAIDQEGGKVNRLKEVYGFMTEHCLDTLEVGQASDVLENQAGFNIFKLTDRKPERPYTQDEIKDELPGAVGQIKERERFDEWIKGLRGKAHIEIREP